MAEDTAERAYAEARRVSFPAWEDFLSGFREAFDALRPPLPPDLYTQLLSVAVKLYEEQFLYLPAVGSGLPNAHRDFYRARVNDAKDAEGALDGFTRKVLFAFLLLVHTLPRFDRLQQPFAVPASTLLKDQYALRQKLYQALPRAEFGPVLDTKVPYGILPDEERFQHTWIVAPSGTGKTTLLENLIYCDLDRVAKNEASVFIMDSQNELIPRITSMPIFHEGGALEGKLIVLEPSTDYPLALNIFDNQLGDTQHLSGEDRENLYASSLEMADFVMSGLLGADLTAKQKGIFRYITQALQVIPGATIHTFADLLSDGGYERYQHFIQTLDPYTVQFFETRFQSSTFKATKEEIFWRLDTIMSNPTFRRMFSHPTNKFNLYDELQSGKVICVNTKLGLLKKEAAEIFGRFFLAMLLQATERRMLIDRDKRMPTFCYIDECHDYVADEPKMASLLDKARKQKVAFTLSHQRLANIKNPDVLDALGNVRMKVAGRNQTDAATLAKLFRTTPEFLSETPQYSFVLNTGGASIVAACPPSPLKGGATADQISRFRGSMRTRFAAPPSPSASSSAPSSPSASSSAPEHKGPTIDGEVVRPAPSRRPGLPKPSGEDIDIKPSKDW